MPHYVTKLGEKNYWRKLRSVRVFVSKTVTVIFFGGLGRRGNKNVKLSIYHRTKKHILVIVNEISKMKQTKN
jgi:hypothetical protein